MSMSINVEEGNQALLQGDRQGSPPVSRSDHEREVGQYRSQRNCLGLAFIGSLLVIGGVSLAYGTKGTNNGADGVDAERQLTVYHNANVYTVDQDMPSATAFAVLNGRFVRVGQSDDLLTEFPTARRVDLEGSTVTPGLTDAHAHLINLGLNELRVDVKDIETVEETVQEMVDYAARNNLNAANGDWLLGRGWDQTRWPNPVFPTKEDLDPLIPDVPVWVRRVDGHAGWANSAAIELIRDRIPEEPIDDGKIILGDDGEPSGVFVGNAMFIFEQSGLFDVTPEQERQAVELGMQRCNELGLTGVHDAGVTAPQMDVYQDMVREDDFTLRDYAYLGCRVRTEYCGDDHEFVIDAGVEHGRGPMFNFRSVKMYVDGALGSHGAAMLAPYSDRNDSYAGYLRIEEPDIYDFVDRYMEKGYQINSHGIGDRANKVVVDALEAAITKHEALGNKGRELRHRMEHFQIARPEEIARLADLGIIGSMQPTHATSDMRYAPERVGMNRLEGPDSMGYAFKSVLNATGVIALGSDFPVEFADPLLTLYAAVAMQDVNGEPAGGFLPEQRLTPEEALKGMTWDAAYAAHQETILGSIEANKWADFVVWDRDLMAALASESPVDALDTQVQRTVVGGRTVYSAQ